MPTNHTTPQQITQRSALSARLMGLALDASDVADLLFAEEMNGPQAEIYVGAPVYVFQRVLDEQLELSRTIARVIPAERRARYLHSGERLPSVLPEYSVAEEDER